MRIAIYAGSFDPITRGHEDLIVRSLEFVDQLIVAVATNATKQPMFTIEERVELIQSALAHEKRVEVKSFSGLLVDFARKPNILQGQNDPLQLGHITVLIYADRRRHDLQLFGSVRLDTRTQ